LAFAYPNGPHIRKHGPRGYGKYQKYRPWLRDEFTFRCVYCLARERWAGRHSQFVIDHVDPQSKNRDTAREYDNLVYCCSTCNQFKRNARVADPCKVAFAECVRVNRDGRIEALNEDGRRLIAVLRLDNKENTRFRHDWLDFIEEFQRTRPDLYLRVMGFPQDLPNLARLRPPGGNTRPDGIKESYFAKWQRRELPEVY
jgi:hypothetical protein